MAISAGASYIDEAPSRRPYDPQAYERARQIGLQYESASLVALLANPERFDGRKLMVSGFLTLEHEGTGLYLDRAAYDAGLSKNAVWLDRPTWPEPEETRRLHRTYAEVVGTFDASKLGAYDHYSGALTQVQRITPTFTAADYQQWRLREGRDVLLSRLLSGWFLTAAGWTGLFLCWLLTRRRT